MNDKAIHYKAASAQSFTLQSAQRQTPVADDEPTVMTIGIQPFGITSRPFGNVGDVVLIANYLAPAQHLGKVTVKDGMLTRDLERVSGAMYGPVWKRGGFPDIDPFAQGNRCWTAVLRHAGSGDYLVGRGDPEFFRLAPPREGEKRWQAVEHIRLPRWHGGPYRSVASATLLSEDRFFTVEHDSDYDCVAVEWEGFSTGRIRLMNEHKLGKFRYGVALAKRNGLERVVSITSFHSKDRMGIYFGDEWIVAGFYGDGICPLINGGALVTQRGMESPEGDSLEMPGALIYIPPKMFPEEFEWVR